LRHRSRSGVATRCVSLEAEKVESRPPGVVGQEQSKEITGLCAKLCAPITEG